MTKNMHPELRNTDNTKSTQKKLKPSFGHFLRPPAWKQSGTILVETEWMDEMRK